MAHEAEVYRCGAEPADTKGWTGWPFEFVAEGWEGDVGGGRCGHDGLSVGVSQGSFRKAVGG